MTGLDVTTRRASEDIVVMSLGGELDYGESHRVEQELERLAAAWPPCLVIDLRELRFLDSTGIRLILEFHRRAEAHGAMIALIPGPPRVQRVFELTRLDRRLRFVEDPADLLASVDQAPEALRTRLAAEPEAPARARAFLTMHLDGKLEAGRLADVQLVVSELVTNSVRHAGLVASDTIELRIAPFADRVRIEVADPGSGLDLDAPRSTAADRGSGWGLFLVDRIATRWGVRPDGGTIVWAEFDRRHTGGNGG